MKIGKYELEEKELYIIKRIFIGISPFILLWFAFMGANIFGLFIEWRWWTFPYCVTCISSIIYSINICSKEFNWS